MQSKYIWLKGRLVNHSEATLHFLTPGLHYGMAVFEGIRCYQTARGPAIFRLREHIERLLGSCKVIGWKQLPFDAAQLIEACRLTVQANGFQECYVRPLVYQAEGGWNLSSDAGEPHVGIAVWEWNGYLGAEAQEKGVRANVSSFTRHQPNVMMTKAKIAGNYPNSVLAKTESMRLGFDEAIMLDGQGMVAECTGENIFAVLNGRISTPPEGNILAGITRDTLRTSTSSGASRSTRSGKRACRARPLARSNTSSRLAARSESGSWAISAGGRSYSKSEVRNPRI